MLSFGDSFLLQDDILLFNDQNWLNDKLIDFSNEYMTEHVLKSSQLSDSILLCCAGVIQLSKVLPESDVPTLLGDLNMSSRSWIFCPINDSECLESVGGTHWSLLVCDVKAKQFYHYDSMDQSNIATAELVAHSLAGSLSWSRNCPLIRCESPRQVNGYDCGMYVIEMTRMLLMKIKESGTIADMDIGRLKPDAIMQARSDWLKVIDQLIQKDA